jgi:hypothetical protein
MGNTYGQAVIVAKTNKSGGAVAKGDVVIIDTANDNAFTTTTSANYTGRVGIVQEAIANNATGRVLISGHAALVNVNASVTRGHYGATYTVAKQATDAGTSRGAGTFCQFTTAGTTPEADVYPPDLTGTSLTNPMTTTGDIIKSSDNSGTPARLAIGNTGDVLTVAGGLPTWAAAPAYARSLIITTGSDLTTTSGTAAEISSSLRVTVTVPASGRVLITQSLIAMVSAVVADVILSVQVDGAGGWTDCAGMAFSTGDATHNKLIFGQVELTGLSAASHTFYMGWRQAGGVTVTTQNTTRGGAQQGDWQSVITIP